MKRRGIAKLTIDVAQFSALLNRFLDSGTHGSQAQECQEYPKDYVEYEGCG